ncbi:aminoglycoside phosphotransferase family protein [Aliiroseovarius lamellibrachiae]|uniref:aminoglycoside phosphotransferase family protein n=1 Tax=Aliiroseovarius lamellibrachiae TaxID=1924933 RepID=UPI001FEB7297|nr:phosphotransferase [Aliiroseovarius lamellibrachiae]
MMRAELIASFLGENGLAKASRTPLAGDASARRYERITQPPTRFILMDDATGNQAAILAFVSIAAHLRGLGLSAPEIFASDIPNGLILMEDLGDAVFAREVGRDPSVEIRLYSAAIDVFTPLHGAPAPTGIPTFDPCTMASATDVAFQWYRQDTGQSLGDGALSAMECLKTALEAVARPPVLSLRDYHAENLIWLPDRTGPARVGLLDFQDAVLTHPIYDLISLTRDARRDVSDQISQVLLSRYASHTQQDLADVTHAAAVVATQRNLRILGVFARLSKQMGKPGYITFIPRVWRMLQEDLTHPDLAPLKRTLNELLPPPDDHLLTCLRTPCPTP